MSNNDKRGLGQPDAPPDIFTVGQQAATESGEPAASKDAAETGSTTKSASRKPSPAKKPATTPREERIKTSVELLPETVELIDQLRSQFRRKNKRHYPMYRVFDDAVQLLAKKELK